MTGLLAFLGAIILDQALLGGDVLRTVIGVIPDSWSYLKDAARTVKDSAG